MTRLQAQADEGWSAEEIHLRSKMQEGFAVVVSVRKHGPHNNLIAWAITEGLFTYVGRYSKYTGHAASIWKNPFKLEQGAVRGATLERYREYLTASTALMGRLAELRGHALGCWCAPESCHGDVLAELVNNDVVATILAYQGR